MRTSGSSFQPDHNFLLIQRYNCPWKMLSLSSSEPSSGKTLFSSERRESDSLHYRNHATHRFARIRDWITRNEFLAVFSRRIPLQQPQRHINPCLFCVFVPLFPSFLRRADRILPQNAVENITFASIALRTADAFPVVPERLSDDRKYVCYSQAIASVDRPCLFVMVKHKTFVHAL